MFTGNFVHVHWKKKYFCRDHSFEHPEAKCILLHILDGLGYDIPAADTDSSDVPVVFESGHPVGGGMALQALSNKTNFSVDHKIFREYRGPVENGNTLPSMLGGRNHLSDQDARNCLFPKLLRFIRALLQVVYEDHDPQHVAYNSRSIRLEDEVFCWNHVPCGAGDRWMANSSFATGLPYDHNGLPCGVFQAAGTIASNSPIQGNGASLDIALNIS